jgi:transaldolase
MNSNYKQGLLDSLCRLAQRPGKVYHETHEWTHPKLFFKAPIGYCKIMSNPAITSLIQSGTKLYLDSIDPALVEQNIEWGAVGATSNPIIISNLIRTGRFDALVSKLLEGGMDDEAICWEMTDTLVSQAQAKFESIWSQSEGNAGWVSFELDPLIEDPARNMPHEERVARYIELGRKWSAGQRNRMIKVPATPAGLDALETLVAEGVTLNVTLIFTLRQYLLARDSVWRGAQRRASLDHFKSVYSIFVSRIDQYTAEHCPGLSREAQGSYGILNAKRIRQENVRFWREHPTPLQQEIIFASTGTKSAADPPWKYVAALAGSDIQTNPPETNSAIAASDQRFTRQVDVMPSDAVCRELDQAVRVDHMESTLMEQGVAKFAAPQKQLIATVAEKRASLLSRA